MYVICLLCTFILVNRYHYHYRYRYRYCYCDRFSLDFALATIKSDQNIACVAGSFVWRTRK